MDRLSELYKQHGAAIYSRCYVILRDHAASEDATQETFLRVQRHLHKAPNSDEALYWIYRIATNYCLNELRDRKRRPQPQASLPEAHALPALIDGRVEEQLVDRDFAARLVEQSAPKLRVAAWLHYVDGLEQTEVAAVLGVSLRTVVNRLTDFGKSAQKFAGRSS